jgi:hypothetical protein
MIDFEDSHEWTMWKASEVVPKPRLTLKEWEAPTKPPKKELYAERRAAKKKTKTAWAARLQTRVNAWVKGKSDPKLEELLGYSSVQLKRHLERQFLKGMTWKNYAGHQPFKTKGTWVIDHIVPKRLFRESEASNAFHITNLRPLWIQDNLKKSVIRDRLV